MQFFSWEKRYHGKHIYLSTEPEKHQEAANKQFYGLLLLLRPLADNHSTTHT